MAFAGLALVTVAAGVTRYLHGVSEIVAFVLATIALAGLAWLVSLATEQVGFRIGPAQAGFLQSTVGNLPEFFVVIFALNAGQLVVAETSILGSIFANALLLLGLVIIAGASLTDDGVMRFSRRLPNDTATLVLVSTFIIVLVGIAHAAHDPASRHIESISIVGAGAVLIVYGTWARQYLRSGAALETGGGGPRMSTAASIALLAVSGTGAAFVSDWFIHALEPTIHTLGISRAFAGLVIVAVAGNAVENTAAILMARKGRSELAISIVKNSVAQVAAFLYPLLVLVSLVTATRLTFSLAPVYIGALFGTAVIVWQISGDGEATLFEGAALVASFVILATLAAFES